MGPVKIPPGAVFVMADYRDAGEDSRHWGPVPKTQIIGRPVWIYWSSMATAIRGGAASVVGFAEKKGRPPRG